MPTKNKMTNTDYTSLENAIGYVFNDKYLLKTALTHSSYASTSKTPAVDNERLEFLGDAVLELCSSEIIYKRFRDKDEGVMTIMRAGAVCEGALAACAKKCGLGDYIYMSLSEEKSGGREKPSILSDAFEAVLGAVYLDGGLNAVKKITDSFLNIEAGAYERDFKSRLQELVQEHHIGNIEYVVDSSSGPAHDMHFVVTVKIAGKACGTGEGKSKQDAGQHAAKQALERLRKN